MSEVLKWNPANGVLKVPTETGEVVGTASNSAVYLHSFEDRGADHIFIQTGENEEQSLGVFIFRIASDTVMENFDRIVGEMAQNRYQTVICDQVAECDRAQYEKTVERVLAGVGLSDLEKPWEVGNA